MRVRALHTRHPLGIVILVCAGWSVSLGDEVVADGSILYVDPQITPASCTTYNIAARSCNGGNDTAYRTLQAAAAVATAGQRVLIRAGTYNEALVPQHNGAPGQYIAFQPYGGEAVTITGTALSPAVDISNRSYIRIAGLTVDNVRRWLLAVNAHHNVLMNNTFSRALDGGGSSKTGLFFESATYNRIVDNVIEDSTQDNLALIQSDHNLFEGNTITKAVHTLWTIKCGSFNLLRGNYFHNELQKIGEVFDCFEVGCDHDITEANATQYNVIEDNVFAYTPSSGDHSPFAGIQYAGQHGIIRRNVFCGTVGPALDMTVYGDEAEFNLDNRIYNNVLCYSQFAGVSIAPAGYNLAGNVFKNNILHDNMFVRHDLRWDWYIELDGKPVEIMIGRQDGFVFEGNDVYNVCAGETYTVTYGQRDAADSPQHALSWWQAGQPALFNANVEAEPRFVSDTERDFHLQAGSPLIDAGVVLTRAAGTGSGADLPVQDAGYFCDGHGIEGVAGDVIRLEGTTQAARVVSVHYATNTLNLDVPVSWSDGQGVSLSYVGEAPDLGAFEHDARRGDMNCDGAVNYADINPFVTLLGGRG